MPFYYPNSSSGSSSGSSLKPVGWFNVLDYGAVGDNTTDDSAAFQAAINAAWINPGNVVVVPPPPGGVAYLWKHPVSLYFNATSMKGIGHPLINFSTTTSTDDALTFAASNTDNYISPYIEGIFLQGDPNTVANRGRDLLTISSGTRLCVRDCHFQNAGRDGLHLEVPSTWYNSFLECCTFDRIMVHMSGRDNVHLETGNVSTGGYINQTLFTMLDSRNPGQGVGGGYSIRLVNNTPSGGAPTATNKISQLTFLNGEFESTGNQLPDGNFIQCAAGGQIEYVQFIGGSTIEDVNGAHTGWAINGSVEAGGLIQNVTTDATTIYYGFAAGHINRSVIN